MAFSLTFIIQETNDKLIVGEDQLKKNVEKLFRQEEKAPKTILELRKENAELIYQWDQIFKLRDVITRDLESEIKKSGASKRHGSTRG